MRFESLIGLLIFPVAGVLAQKENELSPFNGAHWGVVLEHPGVKGVTVNSDILYFEREGRRTLKMDVYKPVGIKTGEKRPSIILINGLGDQTDMQPLKDNSSYVSWAKLLAANGFIAVTMEAEVNRVQESFKSLFDYLENHGANHHIDINKIGIQSFSANGREASAYVMSAGAYRGIKAAVIYYGERPPGPYREDLPLMFVISELDIRNENYSSLWNEVLHTNAPWTITLARDMPHAFDVFSDTETSRRLIMQTISFWKDQLTDLPLSTTPPSEERAIVAARYDRDQSKMLRLMREWMENHPNTDDAYALGAYGGALMDNGSYNEAEKFLKKAIAIEPGNKGVYLNLAVVSYTLGKSKEGDANLVKYEEGTTPEGFTYAYIANRLMAVGQYKFAAELFERALTLPNAAGYMYYNLGCCYAKLYQIDRAFRNLFAATSLGFGNKSSYEKDEDLKSLQSDQRWKELMTKLN